MSTDVFSARQLEEMIKEMWMLRYSCAPPKLITGATRSCIRFHGCAHCFEQRHSRKGITALTGDIAGFAQWFYIAAGRNQKGNSKGKLNGGYQWWCGWRPRALYRATQVKTLKHPKPRILPWWTDRWFYCHDNCPNNVKSFFYLCGPVIAGEVPQI